MSLPCRRNIRSSFRRLAPAELSCVEAFQWRAHLSDNSDPQRCSRSTGGLPWVVSVACRRWARAETGHSGEPGTLGMVTTRILFQSYSVWNAKISRNPHLAQVRHRAFAVTGRYGVHGVIWGSGMTFDKMYKRYKGTLAQKATLMLSLLPPGPVTSSLTLRWHTAWCRNNTQTVVSD